jgi:hypothetical protein
MISARGALRQIALLLSLCVLSGDFLIWVDMVSSYSK